METLGGEIRRRRTAVRMTQQQLADAAGVSVNTVAAIEGGHIPSLRVRRLVWGVLDAVERPSGLPRAVLLGLLGDTNPVNERTEQ